jgi:hypothetical protein
MRVTISTAGGQLTANLKLPRALVMSAVILAQCQQKPAPEMPAPGAP